MWSVHIPEAEYHAAARRGEVVSSTMLREFRQCPAHYRDIVAGRADMPDSDAFRFGRAAHKLILEGDAAFLAAFSVGGPLNRRTGRSYGSGTKAFDEWLGENGLDRRRVVTDSEKSRLARMRDAARAHPEIARLFGCGWPERSVRSEMAGVACQARLDWLRPDGMAADLKTVEDIDSFEQDARRFGYLHQFAFYRETCRAAGAGDIDMVAVVVEKKPPHRAGVWHFAADTLEPYAAQNRQALESLARCRRDNRWPTGYEKTREFPLAGIPPLWLN